MPADNFDGWHEWSRHVLLELERAHKEISVQGSEIDALQDRLTRLETEFKIKSGMVGAISGSAAAAVTAAIMSLVLK